LFGLVRKAKKKEHLNCADEQHEQRCVLVRCLREFYLDETFVHIDEFSARVEKLERFVMMCALKIGW
jgi:hypothetical protein